LRRPSLSDESSLFITVFSLCKAEIAAKIMKNAGMNKFGKFTTERKLGGVAKTFHPANVNSGPERKISATAKGQLPPERSTLRPRLSSK